MFGDKNPLDEIICFYSIYGEPRNLRISGVFKEREQSILACDAITSFEDSYGGGITLLKMNEKTDPEHFRNKLNESNIPTMTGDQGNYYIETLKDAYFNTSLRQESFQILKSREFNLIQTGLFSSILILCIACFNYINLNFSRILQQIRIIHIQKLMGAENATIRQHLFTDICLTVCIAFVLSILLVFDLLPLFNRITSRNLSAGFFFNKQVLPFILFFILLLAMIPAWYISRKLSGLSGSDYRTFFTGKKKYRIVSMLVVFQFAFSIGLITAFITVNKQVKLTKNSSGRYENIIGTGDMFSHTDLAPFREQLKSIPGVISSSTGSGSPLNSLIIQHAIQQNNGPELFFPIQMLTGDEHIFSTIGLQLVSGTPIEEAVQKYATPLYINRKYREKIVPDGENPVGKPINRYENYTEGPEGEMIIAGILEDFHTGSLQTEISPLKLIISKDIRNYIQIRMDTRNKEKTLAEIEKIWNSLYPDQYFTYEDMGAIYISRNRRVFEIANLLLMFSLISISLTRFGLFGMTLYATAQRMKEIGIRKVNGASVLQIMLALNRPFIRWMLLAFILILPVCWYILSGWLENYVYRTDMTFGTALTALGIIFFICTLTVAWQTYKAAHINPVKILRNE